MLFGVLSVFLECLSRLAAAAAFDEGAKLSSDDNDGCANSEGAILGLG